MVILIFTFLIFNYADATTNIDATYKYAWNDVIGWIDFYSTGNVNVSSTQLTGCATSSVGFIALDCATSPSPPAGCSTTFSNWKVTNDGGGNLTGWAYNDAIGWISFDSGTASSSYAYQVTVNTSTGDFSGWAWNDIVGWISFNCLQPNICATSNYKVKTSWVVLGALTADLTSSVFDTGVSTGVAINTIMWQGISHPVPALNSKLLPALLQPDLGLILDPMAQTRLIISQPATTFRPKSIWPITTTTAISAIRYF